MTVKNTGATSLRSSIACISFGGEIFIFCTPVNAITADLWNTTDIASTARRGGRVTTWAAHGDTLARIQTYRQGVQGETNPAHSWRGHHFRRPRHARPEPDPCRKFATRAGRREHLH